MKRLVRSALTAALSASLAAALACGGGDKGQSTTPAAAGSPAAEPAPTGDTAPSTEAPASEAPAAAGAGLAAQIAQGEKVWSDSCAVCHGDSGEGKGKKNPTVVGGGALSRYKTGADLFQYIKEKMPKDDPGSLSEADYLASTAWLLRKNGKLGDDGAAVTAESAGSIAIH